MDDNTQLAPKKQLGHLMLDLESMGNEGNGALVSLAAVEFDINTGETGLEFYTKIDLESSIKAGLTLNADTIMWWLQQSESARASLYADKGMSLSQALFEFAKFLELLDLGSLQLWGNSPRFDMTLLESAYKAVGKKIPWKFRNERCVRTLVSFFPELKKSIPFEGVPHHPIDDCKHQIKYCTAIHKRIVVDKS